MDGVQLPQGYSHFEEAVYFLPFSSQKFLVLISSTLEGWKAESTLFFFQFINKKIILAIGKSCFGSFGSNELENPVLGPSVAIN